MRLLSSPLLHWLICLSIALALHLCLLLLPADKPAQAQSRAQGTGGIEIGLASFKAAPPVIAAPKPQAKPKPKPTPKVEIKKQRPVPVKKQKTPAPKPIPPEPVEIPEPEPETEYEDVEPTTQQEATIHQKQLHQGTQAHNAVGGASAQHDIRVSYQARIKKQLEENKVYPKRAKRRGIQGQARLQFSLLRDGSVKSFTITQSSGKRILDKATLNMLEKAQPFPPFPDQLTEQTLQFEIPVAYFLK